MELPDLEGIPFFNRISIEARRNLASHARSVKYSNGQTILLEGEEGRPVYFVVSGKVRAYRTNPEGREQTLTYLKPGETFNLPAAFSTLRRAPASAMAAEDSTLIEIPWTFFQEAARHHPEFALQIMRELADRLSYFSELVHDVSLRNVRGRLARFILSQAEENTGRGWTQEEIAMQLGTSREVVSRSLRFLVREGAIKMVRQKIIIQDEVYLKNEAGM